MIPKTLLDAFEHQATARGRPWTTTVMATIERKFRAIDQFNRANAGRLAIVRGRRGPVDAVRFLGFTVNVSPSGRFSTSAIVSRGRKHTRIPLGKGVISESGFAFC